jgi:hypothetical protein
MMGSCTCHLDDCQSEAAAHLVKITKIVTCANLARMSIAVFAALAMSYGNTDWTASVQHAGRSAGVIGARALTLSVLGPWRQVSATNILVL